MIGSRDQYRKGLRSAVAVAGVMLVGASTSKANSPPAPPAAVKVNGKQFFSWFVTTTNPNYTVGVNPSGSATGTYVGAPHLTNANAASVNSYLAGLPAGSIRSVVVENPGLSTATANLIFNNTAYNVSYVFGDLEGSSAVSMATTLAKQVHYISANSYNGKTKSYNAYIGNFGFSVQKSNLQAPCDYKFTGQHSFSDYGYNAWNTCGGSAGLTMSNEEAYPGSPSFRNKANGDSPSGGGSYPNIRSSIFVLPLWRIGQVSSDIQNLGLTNHQHIPWTGNFNNWGNLALDTDRNASNGYKFVPGVAMPAKTVGGHYYPAQTAAQTTNQIVSERDFATSILHMRLRGADSFHLLDSGLQGITQTAMQQDAATGWLGEASVNSIFGASDKKTLIGKEAATGYTSSGTFGDGSTIYTVSGTTATKKNVDQTGAIFSGAYSKTLGKLDVLISNASDGSLTIRLPSTIGTYALQTKDFTVAGGTHLLVEYSLSSSKWVVSGQHTPFTAISNSRSGFGIPEPGTLSLLAVAGVFGLNRRKRQVR